MPKIEDPDRDPVKLPAESLKSEVSPRALARGLNFKVHAKAKQMLAEGWEGQGFNNSQAMDYVIIAASNPNIEDEMDDRIRAWWWICNLKFEVWKAKKALGIPIESEDVL